MGLFGRKRSARAQRKADKKRAKHEAKLLTRAERRNLRAARVSQRKITRQQVATLKAEEKLAAKQAEKAARDRLSVESAKKYLKVAQTVLPVAAPVIYKGATAARKGLDNAKAKRLGIAPDQLQAFTGPGARLEIRIAGATESLHRIRTRSNDDETSKFVSASQNRLHDLSTAVKSAEHMPSGPRRHAYQAVGKDLAGIEADILARLGIS